MLFRPLVSLGILLSTLFFVSLSQAALLTPQGQGGVMEKVILPASGLVNLEGESHAVQSVGFGLRMKKVVFVNVKVYLAQLFVSDLATFNKSDALNSFKGQKAIALQMHFLRNVDGETVQKSFKESLEVNNISMTDADVVQFLEVVKNSGEAKSGKKLTIVASTLPDGKEVLAFENTSGQISVVKASPGAINKIFSIWLGKPTDPGVEVLKAALTK